ncbi:MAG: hypothetical protein IJ731_07735 [Eubacterium sp.]|nr:hypothetical protein [Eubacterium sp.]
MYVFVRIFICLLLALIAIILVKKNRKGHNIKVKNAILLITIMSVILYLILMIIPFENCIYTFNSAESSLKYSNLYSPDLTVDGKTTTLTIYRKDVSTNEVLIIPKNNKGWKIGRGIDTKSLNVSSNKLYSVDICNYRNTDEWYIILTDWNDEIYSLCDNKNSTFKELSQTAKSRELKNYVAYIGKFDSSYVLIINNQEFEFVLSDGKRKTYELRLKE